MKNTLTDLNNHLFEQLERLNDESLTDEQIQREIQRTDAVTKIAESIIHNGELSLKAIKAQQDYLGGDDKKLPPMLEANKG